MYGIVLEGGGARGAYQIGFWQALTELGLEYGGIAGTSAGAINGALMLQGDIDIARELWDGITPAKVFNIEPELYEKVSGLDISTNRIAGLFQFIKSTLVGKGLDTSPLRRLLSGAIDEDRVRRSGREFGIVTVNLSDLRPLRLYLQDIPKGKLIDYLLASARLPVFRPDRIDGKRFLDGGFYDSLPVDLLADRGFRDIIAVRLKGMGVRRKLKGEDLNLTYIEPVDNLGPMLEFSQERIRENIQLGYFDTLRVFRGLRGRQYYLRMPLEEGRFFRILADIDAPTLKSLHGRLRGYGTVPDRRFIFEILVPLLAQLLGLDQGASYQDILLGVLERAAAKSGIERFKIYDYEELLAAVAKLSALQGLTTQVRLPSPGMGSELFLWPHRDQVLDELTKQLLPQMLKQD